MRERSSESLRVTGGRALAAGWPILVLHAVLLGLYDLGDSLGWVLLVLAAAPWALFHGQRRVGLLSASRLPVILGLAAVLRLLMVPLPPTLSDDVLRYLWDGKVAASGANPYLLAPESDDLQGLRDDRWKVMPHRDVETVYPPVAVTAFSFAARSPAPVVIWKLMLVAADLLACWWLIALARATGRSEEVCVWYAWSPLATVEIAGMGHLEGLGVLAAVAAVLAVVRARPAVAGTWAAAAVLIKLVPTVAVPAWARATGRPWRLVAVAVMLIVVALAPVVWAARGVPPGWLRFGISWEFNGPLFEPLWRVLEGLDATARVKGGLDHLKALLGAGDGWYTIYPLVYPQLMAKVLLAAGFVGIWAVGLRDRDPVSASGRVFGGLLLCSATVYPWYLLWVLPWAALARHRAWLALAALLPLSYLPQVYDVALMPWVFVAVWVPFAALLLLDRRSRWSTA